MTPNKLPPLPVTDEMILIAVDGFNEAAADGELLLTSLRDKERMRFALKDALRQSQSLPAGAVAYSHRWDADGERCEKCGDKDWMGGACSKPDAREKGEAPAIRELLRDCWTAIIAMGHADELAGLLMRLDQCDNYLATQPAQASEKSGSALVKQIPRRKAYPKPDENGNETGPMEQHAYIEGWNDCVAAIRLATSSQETASE